MESALGLLATVAALASALALYLASPNRAWRPGSARGGLRVAGTVLALLSLAGWIALLGVGAGLCTMLATWMLALVALPYLAWWSGAHRPAEPRSPREIASHHAALGID